MSFDAAEYRAASRQRWEAAAGGWEARRADQQRAAEPVSRWLVDAIAPQPGHVVLELAAGVGETGFLAAERVRPGGRVITTDGADAMVEAARRRAAELGLDNVECRQMEAEWIDLEAASVDGVLCRWGYMLLADPEAALRETRRVLRPGGRVALAVWAAPEDNPWVTAGQRAILDQGLVEPPQPGAPSMFALAQDGRIEELLFAAGFADVEVDAVDITFRAPSFDEWWELQFDTSPSLADALGRADPAGRDAVHDAAEAQLAQFTAADGSLEIPGRSLVAAASA